MQVDSMFTIQIDKTLHFVAAQFTERRISSNQLLDVWSKSEIFTNNHTIFILFFAILLQTKVCLGFQCLPYGMFIVFYFSFWYLIWSCWWVQILVYIGSCRWSYPYRWCQDANKWCISELETWRDLAQLQRNLILAYYLFFMILSDILL